MDTGYPVIPMYFALRSATCIDSSGKVCVIIMCKLGANSISWTYKKYMLLIDKWN